MSAHLDDAEEDEGPKKDCGVNRQSHRNSKIAFWETLNVLGCPRRTQPSQFRIVGFQEIIRGVEVVKVVNAVRTRLDVGGKALMERESRVTKGDSRAGRPQIMYMGLRHA